MRAFIILFFSLLSVNIYAQTPDTTFSSQIVFLPLSSAYVRVNDYAHLIVDSIYYDFEVSAIHSLKNGYFILLHTMINSMKVWASVITAKEKMPGYEKIKKGYTYKMRLFRYFEDPLTRSFIKYPEVYDFLLGGKIISIRSQSVFGYFFATHSLRGLKYIDPVTERKEMNEMETKIQQVNKMACAFIKDIVFFNDPSEVIDYFDKIKTKKVLKNHSFRYSRVKDYLNPPPPPRRNTKKYNYSETCNFDILLLLMLKKDYFLPKKKENYPGFELSCKDIDVEILYYSKNIYTIRAKWKLPGIIPYYRMVFSIVEKNSEFKIIGINRIENDYHPIFYDDPQVSSGN